MAGNAKKKSFIFNVEWQEILLSYPSEVRLEVYDAIIEYVAKGTLSELKPMAKMAFSFIKKEIDYNNGRYNDIVERNRINGRKGGNPNFMKGQPNPYYKGGSKITQDNQTLPNITQDKPINDNDNDNEILSNESINKKEILSSDSIKKNAASAATLKRKEAFYHSLIPYADKYGKEMLRSFFDYWSEMNASQTRMRFEKQPTWELSKRLATWANNEKKYENNKRAATGKTKEERYAEFAKAITAKLAAGDTGSLQDGGESALPF